MNYRTPKDMILYIAHIMDRQRGRGDRGRQGKTGGDRGSEKRGEGVRWEKGEGERDKWVKMEERERGRERGERG